MRKNVLENIMKKNGKVTPPTHVVGHVRDAGAVHVQPELLAVLLQRVPLPRVLGKVGVQPPRLQQLLPDLGHARLADHRLRARGQNVLKFELENLKKKNYRKIVSSLFKNKLVTKNFSEKSWPKVRIGRNQRIFSLKF